MATTEQKQDLVQDIKRPTRYYRISIVGFGGEHVYNTVTQEQFEYWEDQTSALEEYCIYPDDKDVPEYASFLKPKSEDDSDYFLDWWEYDNIEHITGADYYSSDIVIQEIDSDDDSAEEISTVFDGELQEFLEEHNANAVIEEFNQPTTKDNTPIIGIHSLDKGTFYECIVSTDGKIDLSRLTIKAEEVFDETVIFEISYLDEDLENFGGDTRGKSFYVGFVDD